MNNDTITIDKTPPSIFNDVIGPVMRGPSSSHSAAAYRIGKLVKELMSCTIEEIKFTYNKQGSLAYTHTTQGSDMGFFGGLLGLSPADEKLLNTDKLIAESGIKISHRIYDFGNEHPNTYRINVAGLNCLHKIKAISTGGGMIEIQEIDNIPTKLHGDLFELLIFTDHHWNEDLVTGKIQFNHSSVNQNEYLKIINLKSSNPFEKNEFEFIQKQEGVKKVVQLNPVLPVMSSKDIHLPFSSYNEMLEFNSQKNLNLWDMAILYESARSKKTKEEIVRMMDNIAGIMKASIVNGLEGTDYKDRILGQQSHLFQEKMTSKQLIPSELTNHIILNITAIMESKSSMGVIVAAPTAGSCATLPGTLFAIGETMKLSDNQISKALLSAGLVGIFIAKEATFAAEVGGCQAECGSASGMTAAALTDLLGGSVEQAFAAASMALQNSFGWTCDPVANRVEVPCLGKNIMAATNALSCTNMALAKFDQVIPFDQVLKAMHQVGKSLPYELRCTALGGLSTTPASREVDKKINQSGKCS